jgi:hypothetical protein
MTAAARFPARSDPANSQLERPNAIGRIRFSRQLLSMGNAPSGQLIVHLHAIDTATVHCTETTFSRDADGCLCADATPRRSDHQRLQLLVGDRQSRLGSGVCPNESSLMQSSLAQPDPRDRVVRRLVKRYTWCARASRNTRTTRASAVSVPARMSSGSTASHTASTRISAAAHVSVGMQKSPLVGIEFPPPIIDREIADGRESSGRGSYRRTG